MVYPTRLW